MRGIVIAIDRGGCGVELRPGRFEDTLAVRFFNISKTKTFAGENFQEMGDFVKLCFAEFVLSSLKQAKGHLLRAKQIGNPNNFVAQHKIFSAAEILLDINRAAEVARDFFQIIGYDSSWLDSLVPPERFRFLGLSRDLQKIEGAFSWISGAQQQIREIAPELEDNDGNNDGNNNGSNLDNSDWYLDALAHLHLFNQP